MTSRTSFRTNGDLVQLVESLSPLGRQIIRLSQQHLAYPVLLFIQAREAVSSIPLALVELDETLTLIFAEAEAEEFAVEKAKLVPLRTCLSLYLNT